MTDTTEPEALLERLFDAFEEERCEEYPEILADDIVTHENGDEIRGLDEQLEFKKDYKQSDPDAAVTVKEMAASENTVFSRGWHRTGALTSSVPTWRTRKSRSSGF